MKKLMPLFLAIILLAGCGATDISESQQDAVVSDTPESGQSDVAADTSDSSVGLTKNSAPDVEDISAAVSSHLPSTSEYIQQIVEDSVAVFFESGMSEYEKVKAAYDYLIGIGYYTRPVALDIWRFRSQGDTVPSYVETRSLNMLQFGIGTCEDFAASLMMLLEEMDIETRYMTGLTYTRGGGMTYHSWIQAKVDNVWYHLDVELDDGISSDDGMVNYRYFMRGNSTMSGSHFWGQGLIDYAGDRLQPEQIEEVRNEYMGENCPQDYPTPAAKYITVNPQPDTDALRAELLDKLQEYEEVYGELEYMDTNIYPPVFVRYWVGNELEPTADYGNLVRSSDFIREYPIIRTLIHLPEETVDG